MLLAVVVGLALAANEELAQACDAFVGEHELSGVVLVAWGDEVLLERAYGQADVEAERPVTTGTRFLVASLTKPVIGFLTLRLVDAGRLALDDTVREHLEVLDGAPVAGATVHQLLTHTSGLPHYEGWPGFLDDVGRERTDEELLQLVATTPLRGTPGSSFHYSGPGYLLLGLLLERATGEELRDLLEEHVLDPLGMEQSALTDAAEYDGSFARPYERANGALAPAPLRHPSTLAATGGLVTTARDLHRFVRAVQRGELLRPELHEALLEPPGGQYACGLIVYRFPWTGQRFARHKGNMGGVTAHFVFGLDDERIAIALSNLGGAPVDDLDDRLVARVRPREEPAGKPGKGTGEEDPGAGGR